MTTRPWIVDDGLWAQIEPLLPSWPERSPGPKPVPDRLCLQGILYVLHQGWERRLELHDTFISLACSLICWRRLEKARS
ncbi:transposase [Streptomyces olivaceoviridis]|uniref:transposase n=1 Tax=Streptomyces olivaceoviridis TaxID=1921 RepID=UPI003570AE89